LDFALASLGFRTIREEMKNEANDDGSNDFRPLMSIESNPYSFSFRQLAAV